MISKGYWLTGGIYQSWQAGAAQRIWMKQQQNGFASPSLSFPLRTAEWERLRKKMFLPSPGDTVLIYTEEHKQSWINCLKRTMWFFGMQTHRLCSLFVSLVKWAYLHILGHWAMSRTFRQWVKIKASPVKCLILRSAKHIWHQKRGYCGCFGINWGRQFHSMWNFWTHLKWLYNYMLLFFSYNYDT